MVGTKREEQSFQRAVTPTLLYDVNVHKLCIAETQRKDKDPGLRKRLYMDGDTDMEGSNCRLNWESNLNTADG